MALVKPLHQYVNSLGCFGTYLCPIYPEKALTSVLVFTSTTSTVSSSVSPKSPLPHSLSPPLSHANYMPGDYGIMIVANFFYHKRSIFVFQPFFARSDLKFTKSKKCLQKNVSFMLITQPLKKLKKSLC